MKPAFLDSLILQAVPPDEWVVMAKFRYITMHEGERLLSVPQGFRCDLASIPRLARPFITGTSYDRWAAVIHDYLYAHKYPRKWADAVFREALKTAFEQNCDCQPKWYQRAAAKAKRGLMWSAVRLGGWMAYRKTDK